MKLNREQIIKAFECCHTLSSDCLSCPFLEDSKACASVSLMALALIKELTEENEKLNEKIRIRDEIIDYRGKEILRHDKCIRTLHKEIELIKEEVAQKFADYLKEQSFCCDPGNGHSFDAIDIDELDDYVKKFLEE